MGGGGGGGGVVTNKGEHFQLTPGRDKYGRPGI